MSTAGMKVSEKTRAASTPTDVKIPKSRIEAMLEIASEPKPAMSVSEVKMMGRFIQEAAEILVEVGILTNPEPEVVDGAAVGYVQASI